MATYWTCTVPIDQALVKYEATIPGISDHDVIVVDAALKPEYCKKQPRKVYIYSRADWATIKEDINNFANDYISNIASHSVDENWITFREHLQNVINKHVPSKFTSTRQHLPWITTSINLCAARNRGYTIVQRNLATANTGTNSTS